MPVARLEAGLREHDWRAPRRSTGSCWTRWPTRCSRRRTTPPTNLAAEGAGPEPRARRRAAPPSTPCGAASATRSGARHGSASASSAAGTCSSRCTARPTSRRRAAGADRRGARRARAQRVPVIFPLHPAHAGAAEADGRRPPAARRRACLRGRRSATSTSCRCRPARARSSPTRARSRRRPRRSACRCFTLARRRPSARSRSRTARTCCSGEDPRDLADVRPAAAAADAVRDPAVGRPRGRARRGGARRELRARARDERELNLAARGRRGRARTARATSRRCRARPRAARVPSTAGCRSRAITACAPGVDRVVDRARRRARPGEVARPWRPAPPPRPPGSAPSRSFADTSRSTRTTSRLQRAIAGRTDARPSTVATTRKPATWRSANRFERTAARIVRDDDEALHASDYPMAGTACEGGIPAPAGRKITPPSAGSRRIRTLPTAIPVQGGLKVELRDGQREPPDAIRAVLADGDPLARRTIRDALTAAASPSSRRRRTAARRSSSRPSTTPTRS